MTAQLSGKVAVVTGGSGGLGKAIARGLVAEGAAIAEDGAAALADELRSAGARAIAVKVDVGDPDQVKAMVERTLQAFGQLDILVNNAAIPTASPFIDLTLDDWQRTLRTNLTGQFLCAQAALRPMLSRSYGRIINMASISGHRGQDGRTAYGVSKAGVIHMTKVMAVELAGRGIVVNAIAPGPILTDRIRERVSVEARNAYSALLPQRRYGLPEEVANAVVFLASDACGFIAGHTLNIDGGAYAVWPAGMRT